MIDGLLSFAIRQRWLVMIAILAMAGLGAWNFQELPIDAVPDITNVQVQIYSRAAGFSPKSPVIEIAGICSHCRER